MKDIAGIHKGSPIIAEKLYLSDMGRYIEPFSDIEFLSYDSPEYYDPWSSSAVADMIFFPIKIKIQLEYQIRTAADVFLGKYVPLRACPEYFFDPESRCFILPPTSCGFASLFCEKSVKKGEGSRLFLAWFQGPKEDPLSVLRKKLLMFTWESGAVDSSSLVATKKELEDKYKADEDLDKEIEPTLFGNGYITLPDIPILESVIDRIKREDKIVRKAEIAKMEAEIAKREEIERYDWDSIVDFKWDIAFSNYFEKIGFGERELEVWLKQSV